MNHKLCTKDLDIKALAAKAAKKNFDNYGCPYDAKVRQMHL